jgi:WD40 repeat protein
MNFLKTIVFLSIVGWSLVSFGVEEPKIIDTMSKPFFYEIYPGASKSNNSDNTRKIFALGQSEFFLANAQDEVLTKCKSDHAGIIHAFFDESGEYIITTASDQTVDIYDSGCNKLFSITDKVDGIHMGIFGMHEGKLVVITSAKTSNNLSKIWSLPLPAARL